jgi:hypothetical protein
VWGEGAPYRGLADFHHVGDSADPSGAENFPIAVIAPATPTTSYLHTDRLGAPILGTNSSKAVVWDVHRQPAPRLLRCRVPA